MTWEIKNKKDVGLRLNKCNRPGKRLKFLELCLIVMSLHTRAETDKWEHRINDFESEGQVLRINSVLEESIEGASHRIDVTVEKWFIGLLVCYLFSPIKHKHHK